MQEKRTLNQNGHGPDEDGSGESIEFYYEFENQQLFRALCGVADSQVSGLESMLQVTLIPRDHAFLIRAPSHTLIEETRRYFDAPEERYAHEKQALPERFDREYIYRKVMERSSRKPSGQEGGDESEGSARTDSGNGGADESSEKAGAGGGSTTEEDLESLKEKIFTTYRGRPIYPRTINQANYVRSLLENTITFSVGPAGTGKTFLGITVACRMLLAGDVDRIILTRPAVEAGESLGFLPGDLAQKVDPYLRPIYDALYENLGVEKVQEFIATARIEIAPLAYMRGRTLNNAFIILDEAQNCTMAQLKMFLTRLGRNSRMCVGGDVTQVDIMPGKSGLTHATKMLKNVEGIRVIQFGRQDIIRNPLVERILQAFESEEKPGHENRKQDGPGSA